LVKHPPGLNLWPDEKDRFKLINELKTTGRIANFETYFRHKDGKIGRTVISAEKIISDGRDCLIIYLRLVTAQRKTEDQYRLLAENSTDVIWILQPGGKFSYVSPSVHKLRGYTPDEVLCQTLNDIMTEESVQKVSILLEALIDNKTSESDLSDSFQTEVEQLCKDGTTVWTEVMVTPIRNKKGNLKEILGVSRNIQGKRIAQQKAFERNKALESIFRSSPTGMGMVVNRTLSLVNNRLCEMLGYKRKDMLGKDARFLYESDEEYNRVGKIKYKKIKDNGTGGINTRLVKKDGSVMEVYMSSSPVDINDWGKGVIFNILDLTKIREAESELAANKKKYSSLFDHINDAILIHPWKESGFSNFVEVNKNACETYGYSRDEFLGMSANDITISNDIDKHSKKTFREKILSMGSMVFEATHIRRDGSRFPVEISSNIVDLYNDKIILAVVRDISERKEAELALVESEHKHRKMFENSPEAMVLVDKLGFITECNSAFCKVSGRRAEEILGKHFSKTNLLSFKKMPEYIKMFNSVIRKKDSNKFDFEWFSTNGESRMGVAHLGPIIQKGKINGIQALLKDTTRQKEFENNLIRAKEKAEENDRLKTAFLETMSHELRTPLNAVIGFSNLIEGEKDLENINEMNRYVSENGKKLLAIIESIFDISILETNTKEVRSDSVVLNELFSELEHTVNGVIEYEKKGNINILFQPDRNINNPIITTDKNRLKQLLTNLLTNAVKFTDIGSVRYGYTFNNGQIEFFVSDTGIGIPTNKREMIFEKFQQLDYSPTRTRGGLGLGLAICKEISSLLNGELRVESTLTKGSTFYFSIPVNPSANKTVSAHGIDLTGKCFLIVEDVESNYLYLEKLLVDSGAKVIWAQTGEEAISVASRIDSIDLILMDIRMPDMNGYDITREIKKISPHIPIVAQTAYAMVSDQKEAMEAGCSEHISKPIRVEDLKNTITRLLPAKNPRRIVI